MPVDERLKGKRSIHCSVAAGSYNAGQRVRMSLKLVREEAHGVCLGSLDTEDSQTEPLPRDGRLRVRLPDGSPDAFGPGLDTIPDVERMSDEPDDFSDRGEPVHDDDGYKG
jgi:hypothetical protein